MSFSMYALSLQEAERLAAVTDAQNNYAAAKAAYLAEAEQRFMLPAAQQQVFLQTVTNVLKTACHQLEQDHKGLIDADKENSRVLNNRQVASSSPRCLQKQPFGVHR